MGLITNKDEANLLHAQDILISNGSINKKESLVHMIAYRVYTEWCMEGNGIIWQTYTGQALTRFLEDEVHYHLSRQGIENAPNNDRYLKEKERVLFAFIRYADNFFKECIGNLRRGDKNLRTSLQEWIR